MYLSAKEAAARKGVTPAAIYAAFESGLLESVVIAGKKVTTEDALSRYAPLARNARRGKPLRRRSQEQETV